MINPMVAAIQAARSQPGQLAPAAPMQDGDPNMTMPMGQDKDSGTLLLERSIFNKVGVKVGDTITVTGKVTALGNKIGFDPTSAVKAGAVAEPEGEFDEDLEGDFPPSNPPKI